MPKREKRYSKRQGETRRQGDIERVKGRPWEIKRDRERATEKDKKR